MATYGIATKGARVGCQRNDSHRMLRGSLAKLWWPGFQMLRCLSKELGEDAYERKHLDVVRSTRPGRLNRRQAVLHAQMQFPSIAESRRVPLCC